MPERRENFGEGNKNDHGTQEMQKGLERWNIAEKRGAANENDHGTHGMPKEINC